MDSQLLFSLADLESIKYPNGYFDIVLNKDVIEHAVFYEAILAELARLTGKRLFYQCLSGCTINLILSIENLKGFTITDMTGISFTASCQTMALEYLR